MTNSSRVTDRRSLVDIFLVVDDCEAARRRQRGSGTRSGATLSLSLSDGARTGGRKGSMGEMGIDAGRLGLRAGVGGWA